MISGRRAIFTPLLAQLFIPLYLVSTLKKHVKSKKTLKLLASGDGDGAGVFAEYLTFSHIA